MFDKLEDLIGIPYISNGRDPSVGLDCLGLVLWVGGSILGMDMKIEKPASPASWMRLVRELEPNEGMLRHDFILMHGNLVNQGLVIHSGVALDDDNIVHASIYHGSVVCERLSRLSHSIRGTYRMKA
jgi:cell wall-associated NlpC family hydrolase